MKAVHIILSVLLILVCGVTWIVAGTQTLSETGRYIAYINEADEWVDEGLYQRAIESYNLALEEKESEELYEKINHAYELRYKEAKEDTIGDYMDFLEIAVKLYPSNRALVDSFLDIYFSQEKYDEVYDCLINAIDNGYDTLKIQSMLLNVKYIYQLKKSEFEKIVESGAGLYTIKRYRGWNVYSLEDGYLLTDDYEYIGTCSEDGIFVVTGEDSRLIDDTGFVLGIFKDKVTEAGAFSEGLVPASCGKEYSYYDEFAKKQFGEYEYAGMFQDGLAAVKKNGKWMLINKSGEEQTEKFDEIILDSIGRYSIDGCVIAKKNGKYGIYDEDMELEAELDCTAIDVYAGDDLIAFCKNDKWGFINTNGEVIIKPAYENARSFSNGIAAVCKDGKWGFIDKERNLVIDYEFTDVGYMQSTGVCSVRVDEVQEPEEGMEEETEETEENEETEDEKEEEEKPLEVWRFLKLEIGIKE